MCFLRAPHERDRIRFDQLWEQTPVTTRLVVSYFNWIWRHHRFKTTVANEQTSLTNPGLGMISLLIPRSFDAPLDFLYLGKEEVIASIYFRDANAVDCLYSSSSRAALTFWE
jgi:hypothetical protein